MDQIDQLLTRRVAKILPDKEGLKQLMGQKKIRLYQGFDPTGSKLHLGHTVGLRKLMEFANAGHEVIFLFGTGTVLVGDPSQRHTARKIITQEEIDQNIKDWQKQVAPIVDFDKVTIKQNGDWLLPLTLKDIVHIASNISAIQLFKRDMFQRRLEAGDTVWYHETMYPLLQGYDSVAMDVDLEIGGTDQEFNMLIGRELMRKMKGKEKFVLTTPMILGTDGQQMSKTSGNCVWLDDSPEDMFGKLMSISDDQIPAYQELLTDLPSIATSNPMEAKKDLAFDIVSQFHGPAAAQTAQAHFENIFQRQMTPTNIPSEDIGLAHQKQKFFDVCKTALIKFKNNKLPSNGEIKRMIEQGGASLDGITYTDPQQAIDFQPPHILRYGKLAFMKLI